MISDKLNNCQNKKNELEDENLNFQNNIIPILEKDSKCKIFSSERRRNNEVTEMPRIINSNKNSDDSFTLFSTLTKIGNDNSLNNICNKLILDKSMEFEKLNQFVGKILTNDLNIFSKAKSLPSYFFCNGDEYNKIIKTLNNLNNELILGLNNKFNLLDINKGCEDINNYFLNFIVLYSNFLYSLEYSQTIHKNMFEYFERIYKNLENNITKDL